MGSGLAPHCGLCNCDWARFLIPVGWGFGAGSVRVVRMDRILKGPAVVAT